MAELLCPSAKPLVNANAIAKGFTRVEQLIDEDGFFFFCKL